jgi:hypothetical protein
MSRYQISVGVLSVAFAGMLAILGVGVGEAWHGWRSQGWPQVSGTVTESSVASSRSRVEKKVLHSREERTTSHWVTLFTPVVKYKYEVSERQCESDRISISDGILVENQELVAAIAAKYPVGSNVTVYHHPSDPTLAVLETGISEGAKATLVIGLLFSLTLGGMLAFASSRTGKNVITAFTQSSPNRDSESSKRRRHKPPKHREP